MQPPLCQNSRPFASTCSRSVGVRGFSLLVAASLLRNTLFPRSALSPQSAVKIFVFSMGRFSAFGISLLAAFACIAAAPTPAPDNFSVLDFGAKGNGTND